MGLKNFISAAAVVMSLSLSSVPNVQSLECRTDSFKSQTSFLKPTVSAQDMNIQPLDFYLVSQVEGRTTSNQKPKYAKQGEDVTLHAVLKAKQDGKIIYFTEAKNPKIKGQKIRKKQIKPWPSPLKHKVKWFKVEPTSNSYRYITSRNPITYTETSLTTGWKIKADVHPTTLQDQFPDLESGLGVMRYKATITINNQTFSTPGKESTRGGGLDNQKVHRVSFRPDTGSWVDHLFELFNTPYIWGSNTHEIDGQIGSDCADFALYGWRRQGHRKPYTWSYGLRGKEYTRRIAKISSTNKHGQLLDKNSRPLTYEKVRKGDLIFWPRHIGVLYQDDGDNLLGCNDLVLHTLYHEPQIEPLCDAFGIPEEVLRWKK